MKTEQKTNLLYAVIGLAMGYASQFLQSWLAILVALAVYIVSFVVVRRLVKKKTRWLFENSVGSFFLMWIILWILLINII